MYIFIHNTLKLYITHKKHINNVYVHTLGNRFFPMSSLSIAPPPGAPASLETPYSILTSSLLPVGIPVYRYTPKDSQLTSTDESEHVPFACESGLSQSG